MAEWFSNYRPRPKDTTIESVRDLIPPPRQEHRKQQRYRSQYPGNIAPTFSTLATSTTSLPGCYNIAGDYDPRPHSHPSHRVIRSSATFGSPMTCRSDPSTYTRKGSGWPDLPPCQPFHYPECQTARKSSVPKSENSPILCAPTSKNFITTNAIEAILSEPRRREASSMNYIGKKDFGQVPAYLQVMRQKEDSRKRKEEQQRAEAARRATDYLVPMSPVKRNQLLDALKTKWEETNHEYQLKSTLSLASLDTVSKVRNKEGFERDLERLEKEIKKLSSPQNIYVLEKH
eukprot:TRINITY_DN17071_c0_g1::TRINITY_DN17071_c0_g1_i1::g.21030::m.21030 TRINITY_DN17071_c0_g1::TRINITY_DN17071_c0_g1_i1::g.21030  ORF type:complete len:313 (-),score=14.88,sp/Q6SP97/ENKUR_MOUSE/27.67/4e-14,Enkurin/PF13864.1/1.8e-16,Exonuc_VII_L/PF02601.10/0.25 TRINITY_DN17071_c0_g1_i1:25-888(-)